jgi:purine-binding chemotaxis protein CheW
MQTSNAMRDSAQRGLGLKGAGDDARRGDLEVLTFDLSGEVFALEAILVREVLDQCPETQVPGASGFVDAVINFRGRIVPLADLRMAFGLTRAAASLDSRIIVIEFEIAEEAILIGLRADKVFEVTMIAHTVTEAAPRLGTRWPPDFIRCLAKRHDDIIVLPNLVNIFAARGEVHAGASP